MTINALRSAYRDEAKLKDGQFKGSGIQAEAEVWEVLKDRGWKGNNTKDATAIDFISPSGKLVDLKLCKAGKYGGSFFHEVVQNMGIESISDTRADGWLYWDVLEDRAPLHFIEKEMVEQHLHGQSQKSVAEMEIEGKHHGCRLHWGGHASNKQARGVLIHTASARYSVPMI